MGLNLACWGIEPQVQEGYGIQAWAKVPNARQMALSPSGKLYVGTRKRGDVYALAIEEPNAIQTIHSGLTMPSGLALHPSGDLYVSALNEIWWLPKADRVLKERASHKPLPWRRLIASLPSESHHGWKAITFSPDGGELIVPVGAPCNICLVYPERSNEPFGTILSLKTGALKQGRLEYRVLAKGVRNSVGVAFDPQDQALWFSDNGRDWMGDDMPPCEINRISPTSTHTPHFGYPFVHGNPASRGALESDREILGRTPKSVEFVNPLVEIQAHSAPLGIHFYKAQKGPLKGALIVAEHGSWNRSSPVGYRVSAYWFKGDNVVRHQIIANYLVDGEKLGRPVDIEELENGNLLISDDAQGLIWLLSVPR